MGPPIFIDYGSRWGGRFITYVIDGRPESDLQWGDLPEVVYIDFGTKHWDDQVAFLSRRIAVEALIGRGLKEVILYRGDIRGGPYGRFAPVDLPFN